MTARFIELGGEVNTRMPYHVVDRIGEAPDRHAGTGFTGARVPVLGLAYKKNVDDIRKSPSLRLIELIEARGESCDRHDFCVPGDHPHPRTSHPGGAPDGLEAGIPASCDAVLIATDHDDVRYRLVVENATVASIRGTFAQGLAYPAQPSSTRESSAGGDRP